MPDALRHFPVLLIALMVTVGCDVSTSEPRDERAPDTREPTHWSDAPIASPALRMVRLRAWPGAGIQLTLAGTDAADATLLDADGAPLPDQIAHPVNPSHGLTLLALRGDPSNGEIALADALLEALPMSERIAIWRLDHLATPLADFTRDRAHLHTVLAHFPEGTEPATELAVSHARDILSELDGVWGPVARDLVLVGPTPDLEVSLTTFQPVRIHRVLPGDNALTAAADFATAQVDERSQMIRLGGCGDLPQGASLQLSADGFTKTLPIPAGTTGMSAVECDAANAAEDIHPFGDTIALEFTPSQRALFDARHAANSPLEFEGGVRIGPSDVLDATLHFRGHTSLECERKSLHVNLKGDPHRRTQPGTASDRFLLISMCKDDRYHQQAFADRLMRELGMFPLAFRFVRVRIDDENAGIFFQLDEPDSTLERTHGALQSIVRRRFDPEDELEDVKLPDDPSGIADALQRYHAFTDLPQSLSGNELMVQLESRMALDRYLEWMAFNSLVQNGDFVDEVFFHASNTGTGSWYFRFMAWDPDDLLSECHHGGKHALTDPHGLLFCAEADLDHALLASPEIYARFTLHLERLATEVLTDAHLKETLEDVRDELFAVLDTPETVGAMTELLKSNPNATTVATAQADIEAHMEALLAGLTERRELLLKRITRFQTMGEAP